VHEGDGRPAPHSRPSPGAVAAAATSIRELARRHDTGRRMVRQALASAVPGPRKRPERIAPSLGPFRETVDGTAGSGTT